MLGIWRSRWGACVEAGVIIMGACVLRVFDLEKACLLETCMEVCGAALGYRYRRVSMAGAPSSKLCRRCRPKLQHPSIISEPKQDDGITLDVL